MKYLKNVQSFFFSHPKQFLNWYIFSRNIFQVFFLFLRKRCKIYKILLKQFEWASKAIKFLKIIFRILFFQSRKLPHRSIIKYNINTSIKKKKKKRNNYTRKRLVIEIKIVHQSWLSYDHLSLNLYNFQFNLSNFTDWWIFISNTILWFRLCTGNK